MTLAERILQIVDALPSPDSSVTLTRSDLVGMVEESGGVNAADLTVDQGYEAARWCALNLLARMKAELGDLDRVTRILKVVGMVNSSPDFEEQAKVIDGASDLFVNLFGEAGRHSRSAPGMAVFPGNTAVIVDCVIETAVD